jgi:hypothetical protein
MNPDLADLYANYAAAERDRSSREAAAPWVLFFLYDGTPFLYIGTAGEPMCKTIDDGVRGVFERRGRAPERAEVTVADYIRLQEETTGIRGTLGRVLRLRTLYGAIDVFCRREPQP